MANATDLLRGLRVLIVEDEGLIAMELGDRLSRIGMTVVATVDSADLAVATAIETRPDLVLMDIRIKGKRDGVQAAEEIRQSLDTPIVFLTAHSDRATLDRAKQTSPFGYILKPFQERELLTVIEMAVRRHALECQLKASGRRYVSALASISNGVIATDLSARVTFMNAAAEAFTGWSFTVARGRSIDEVFSVARDVVGTAPVSALTLALTDYRNIQFDNTDLFLFSKMNEAIPLDLAAAPVLDDRGRLTGGVVTFRDIRDKELADDALERAQDELLHVQKMESAGRLASGIAYDLDSLIAVINGCGDLALANENLDKTTRALIQEIADAGNRAATLTTQFLALGQRQILQRRAVDINTLAAGITTTLRRILGEDVTLHPIKISDHTLFVLADATQLEQALVNVVVHLRDAITDGGAIHVEFGQRIVETYAPTNSGVEPGRYVLITVTDAGSRVHEATTDTVFESYFSAKQFRKSSELGMATTYEIVKQSGGFLDIESESGRPVAFRIYLPLCEEFAQSELSGVDNDLDIIAHGTETILLVEDEQSVRDLLQAVLKREGYTVLTAATGEQALLDFARYTDPIHLVISDVAMPGMRGPALVKRLAISATNFRVLYISGHSVDEALFAPGVAFLHKPFTPPTLMRKIRDLLDGQYD